MRDRVSAYGDTFADVYDEWFADTSDADAAAACIGDLADGTGGAILELGVGTGRLALRLVAAGHDVWGVDASAPMLARLRAKPGGRQVRCVLADMAALPFGSGPRFGVAVVAYNTLFNLVRPGAQAACFRDVGARLTDRGRFAVEAFVPDPGAGDGDAATLRSATADGVVVSASRHDRATRRIEGRYVEMTGHATTVRPWQVRYRYPAELDDLAAGAGLRLVDRWAGWDRSAFSPADSPAHVSVYARV
jgi:SAM-dependent methyltransferase